MGKEDFLNKVKIPFKPSSSDFDLNETLDEDNDVPDDLID